MSWLGWGSSTNPLYEELVEKACSPLNLPYPQSENIADSLEVTDMIRSKAVQPKPAMQSLKRRIGSTNGRVQMYAIGLIDTCIKNGGDHFLGEIASKEFVDEMSRIIKAPTTSPEARQMALKYFQQWAIAFKPKTELAFFVDVYNELKNSGVDFPPPPAATSSHLLTTTTAPQWQDSDVCMRCRTAFTFTNRKHHCRNCGLVFDQACSSKSLPLPLFGITTPVRVCDSCYIKCGGGKVSSAASGPAPAVPTGRTMRSKEDFDADLQRAIEASLADSREAGPSVGMGSEPPLARTRQAVEDDDEELRMAIEASLRDAERARPSAPNGYDEPEYKPLPTFDLAPRETETILTFSNTLDQMAAYGERDLRRFPHAHVLYEQAYGIGGKLHRNVEEKTTKQQMLAEMQDKLSQAIGLYGNILDGQQAYNAQKLQEQQQRQYAQHQQQSFGQYNPYQQQSYAPYDPRYASQSPHPQTNGYGHAPPQQQAYQPQVAGSSLYPAMPSVSQPQVYQPQGYPGQPAQFASPAQPVWSTIDPGFNQGYGEAQLRGSEEQYYARKQQQEYQNRQNPSQPTLERHASVRSVSSASATHAPLQRHTSASYQPQPQQQPPSSEQPSLNPSAAHFIPSSAPPVDMSTHPTASPTSATSALPPNGIHNQVSPQKQALPQQQQQQQQSAQSPPQHVYYETSFPPAPAAVFPDAPQADFDYAQQQQSSQGIEKKEKEEALLIEL